MMKKKIPFFYVAFGLITYGGLFLNDANGRKGSYAGAPNDQTCTSCHSDRTHDINGKMTLTGAPQNFVAGTSYPLTLTLKDATGISGGFQIVATNNTIGDNTMFGTFTAGTGTKIASTTGTTPFRLTHNAPKQFAGGQVSWTFSWTAPSTGSNVRFYFAGNASNNDNDETIGDAIYTSTQLTVPVELLSFDGNMMGKSVELAWKTASERNNRVFEIERKTTDDSDKFEKIGEVKGLGNSAATHTYTFTDDAPQADKSNYYRLRQVDLDGTATFSKVISIALNAENKAIKAYPNFVNRGVDIQLETANTSVVAFNIVDISGKIIQHITKGQNTEVVKIATNGLPTGRYFIRSTGHLIPLTATFIVF
jgi:hypothetical protein